MENNFYISYSNYNGGVNNIVNIESHNILTQSSKGKDVAIKNHIIKLKKKGLI